MLCVPAGILRHCRLSIDRWHFYLVAEGGLRKADRQFVEDIVALAFEKLVRLDGEDDVQVARRATTRTDFTFTGHTHIDAIIDAGGDIDHYAAVVAHAALTTTFLTGSGDDTSLATTAFAHRDVDKLTENGLLYAAYLASSLAGRTARSRCSRLRAIATTGVTGFPTGELDLFLATKDSLLKGNSQVIAQIGAALCT